MAKKSKSLARDIIEQGLISARSITAFVKNITRDKRTKQTTKQALKELQRDRPDSQVAADLGISRQRYTALKKEVKKGKAYSPELRDLFKEVAKPARVEPVKVKPTRTRREKEIDSETDISVLETVTAERLKEGVYLFSDIDTLKENNTVEVIKVFASKKSATNFWKTIINSGKYVAIAKDKEGFYSVVGFGKREERPSTRTRKLKNGRTKSETFIERPGQNRVQDIIKNNSEYIKRKRKK